jgi:group I intron endonuclease
MEKIFIYGIYDSEEPQLIRYVGKTKKKIQERLNQHIYLSKRKVKRPLYLWIKKLLDDGKKPEVVLIEETDDKEWVEKEIFWIRFYRKNEKLLNLSDGGESNLNYVPSLETRKKISESNLGKHNFWKGKKLSDEHKKKIGISGLGKKRSENTKKNISESLKGKKLSDEHKMKISQNSPYKNKIAKNVRRVAKIDIITDNVIEIYESLEIASKENNIKNKGNITMVCRGIRNYCGGFKWKYI